jgi:hypothetical protein
MMPAPQRSQKCSLATVGASGLHQALGKLGLSYSWQKTHYRRAVFYVCRTDVATRMCGD